MAARQSLRQQAFRVVFATAVVPLSGLAVAPVLAQGLGVDGRGQVSAATSILFIAVAVASFGVPEAANFLVAKDRHTTRKVTRRVIWILALHGLAVGLAIMLLAPTLSHGDTATRNLIFLAVTMIIPTVIAGGLQGIAQGLYRWDLVNRARYWNAGLRLFGLAALLAFGVMTPLLALCVLIMTPVVTAVVYVGLRSEANRTDPSLAKVDAGSRRILGYGSSQWIGSLSGVVLSRIDQVLMIPLAGSFQLGIYAVAVSIGDGMLFVSEAIRMVLFSAEASAPSDERVSRAARSGLLITGLLGVLVAVSMVIWLPILFGEDFRPSIGPALILVAGAILGVPGFLAGAAIAARGRPIIRSVSLIVAAIVNMVFLLLLAPGLGATGAAIATVIGILSGSNVNILAMKRLHGTYFRDYYLIRRADVSYVMQFARETVRRKLSRSFGRTV